jgi:hypothetical protein
MATDPLGMWPRHLVSCTSWYLQETYGPKGMSLHPFLGRGLTQAEDTCIGLGIQRVPAGGKLQAIVSMACSFWPT